MQTWIAIILTKFQPPPPKKKKKKKKNHLVNLVLLSKV